MKQIIVDAFAPVKRVVPYIGTWIETQAGLATCFGNSVVPYIGTWIETGLVDSNVAPAASYLI